MVFVLVIFGLVVEFVSFVFLFWIFKIFDNGIVINVGLWLICVDLDCIGISSSLGRFMVNIDFDIVKLGKFFFILCIFMYIKFYLIKMLK